jgi:uncharacterized protein YndB with AHSA1/START domain
MESKNRIAKAELAINAPVDRVWNALVNPEIIKKYMFGTTVISDWNEGSKITWKGEWKGKPYEDKGVILEIKPNKKLQYSHFSPLSGSVDTPENYHTVTINLLDHGKHSVISLSQDNNATEDEMEHSKKNWTMMLDSIKNIVEENS